MSKVENVVEYYVLTNKLKEVVRTGWKKWNIKKDRLESIAEHIYGTCMLAIAIWSETLPPVNLAEVLMTLAVHETEEIVIGDITPFEDGYDNKREKGEKAVEEIFEHLMGREIFTTLIKNFDEQSTPEAIFAYKCDKLECDLQAKMYDEQGYAKFEYANDEIKKDKRIINLQKRGVKKVSSFFLYSDRPKFESKEKTDDDEEEDLFLEVSKYVEKNSMLAFNKYPVKKEEKKTPVQKTETPIAKKVDKKA